MPESAAECSEASPSPIEAFPVGRDTALPSPQSSLGISTQLALLFEHSAHYGFEANNPNSPRSVKVLSPLLAVMSSR
jgi:hypothetical protein